MNAARRQCGLKVPFLQPTSLKFALNFELKLQDVSYTPERKKRLAPENGGPLIEKVDSKTWKPTIFLEVYAFVFFQGLK